MLAQHTVPSLATWFNEPFKNQIVDEVQFAWVGQAGFLFKTEEARIGIDFYLSDSLNNPAHNALFSHERMMESPIRSEELKNLDIVLCTHGHEDHIDKESLLPLFSADKGPLVIAPRYETQLLIDIGIPVQRIVGMSEGEIYSPMPGVIIRAIASAHEQLEYDQYHNTRALGFILDLGTLSIYHSGDCIEYPLLKETLQLLEPQVCLLPVNGRTIELTEQGIIGNFTIKEAAELARQAGSSLLVPHHFGMFAYNTVSPEEVETRLTKLGWVLNKSFVIPQVNTVYTVVSDSM